MSKLTPKDLYSLEQYTDMRNDFRARVMIHKKDRRVAIGDHAALYFEDAMTMQYQVQEMLRIERISDVASIQAELEVYNPLIPDGANWKATFMIEYQDIIERREALALLIGIEAHVYVQVDEFERVYAIFNEDLARSTEDKTSAVHFMRFELTPGMIAAIFANATVRAGINHPKYTTENIFTDATLASLRVDLYRP